MLMRRHVFFWLTSACEFVIQDRHAEGPGSNPGVADKANTNLRGPKMVSLTSPFQKHVNH